MRPFDIDRHRVFFGRADEIKQLAELVRSAAERAVLIVVGPSGCGKSSLVRAGLLPVLASEPGWRTLAPILPGADPVAALARELAAAARRIGQPLTGYHGRVLSVAFSPDGHILATAGDHGTVILWDLTDRTQPHPSANP